MSNLQLMLLINLASRYPPEITKFCVKIDLVINETVAYKT